MPKVIQEDGAPVEKTVLAKAIVDISSAMTALRKSGLNRKAIVILTSHAAQVPQGTVKAVLDGLEDLRRSYCS